VGAFAVSAAVFPAVSSAAVARHAASTSVTVTFKGSQLEISRPSLEAGTATFLVVNKGPKAHSLAITGPGLKGVRTPKIASGRTAKLTVTLRAGSYMLSDPALQDGNVHWVQVDPATNVQSTGGSYVVSPPLNEQPGMNCS
jgi:hypothetical protein